MQKESKSSKVEQVVINVHVNDIRIIPASIPMEDKVTWEIRQEERKKEASHTTTKVIKYERKFYGMSHTFEMLLKSYGVIHAYYVPKEWYGASGYKITIVLHKDVHTRVGDDVMEDVTQMFTEYVFKYSRTYVNYGASHASINLTLMMKKKEGKPVCTEFALKKPAKKDNHRQKKQFHGGARRPKKPNNPAIGKAFEALRLVKSA